MGEGVAALAKELSRVSYNMARDETRKHIG
jgi:hypothetical protein